MAEFLAIWGGQEANEEGVTQKDTDETASESSSWNSCSDTPKSTLHTLGYSPTDEEIELSPHAPSPKSAFCNAQKLEDIFDEEHLPLSPEQHISTDLTAQTPLHPIQYTAEAKELTDGDVDECQPLTPQTPNIEAVGQRKRGRFKTPDFLSPGTFRRWRRLDEEKDLASEHQFPSPLMKSPRECGGMSHFSHTMNMSNFIPPLRRQENR